MRKKFEGKEAETIRMITKWHYEQQMSIKKMSQLLGCCEDTLSKFMIKNDIEKKTPLDFKAEGKTIKFRGKEEETIRLIKKRYFDEGETLKEVRERLNCSNDTLLRFMAENDLKKRTRSENAKLNMKKRIKKNCKSCGMIIFTTKNNVNRTLYCSQCREKRKKEKKRKYAQRRREERREERRIRKRLEEEKKRELREERKPIEGKDFKKKGNLIFCTGCEKQFNSWLMYEDHFPSCLPKEERYTREIARKLREKYKKGEKITPRKTCIALNCEPSILHFKKSIKNYDALTEKQDQVIRDIIKDYVKLKGTGKHVNPKKMSAIVTYMILQLTDFRLSQGKFCEWFKISTTTLRAERAIFKTFIPELSKKHPILEKYLPKKEVKGNEREKDETIGL